MILRLLRCSGVMETLLQLGETKDVTASAISEKLFQLGIECIMYWCATDKCQLIQNETKAVLRWLLESGQDPNISLYIKPFGILMTSLQVALCNRQSDITMMLLEAGADPNITSSHVFNPLSIAVRSGVFETVETLLNHGAKIRCDPEYSVCTATTLPYRAQLPFSKTRNSLAFASSLKPEPIAFQITQYLLGHLRKQGDKSEITNTILTESLIAAAGKGNNKVLALLLDQGIHISATNSMGISALHTAAYWGHLKTCELMLARGVEVEVPAYASNVPSPLHLAYHDNLDVVKLLQAWGADIDRTIIPGRHMKYLYYGYKFGIFKSEQSYKLCESPVAAAMSNDKTGDTYRHLINSGAVIPRWAAHYGAVIADNLKLITFVIQMTRNANSPGYDGRTPLQAAVTIRIDDGENTKEMRKKIALFLLENGATPVGGEAVDAMGLGSWDLVEQILHRDTNNVATTHPHMTMLYAAILEGSPSMVQNVFKLQPSAYDGDALCAATHLAGADGGISLVTLLLKNRLPHEIPEDRETSAACIASWHRNIPLLRLLLENLSLRQTVRVPLFYHSTGVNQSLASALTKPDMYEEIRSEPRWLRICTEISPISLAAYSPLTRTLLLGHGYRPNRYTITLAARNKSLEVVEELWPYYQKQEDLISFEHGPLYEAVGGGIIDMVKFFLNAGEDVNDDEKCVKYGRTPLQKAAENGDVAILDLLLKRGADINAPASSYGGATALQAACINGLVGITKKLIELGANINAPRAEQWGRTALEGAAERGRIDIIQLLLSRGANTTGRGRLQYIRAIRFAEEECHHAAAKILKSHREWSEKDENLSERIELVMAEDELDIIGDDPGAVESDFDWDEEYQDRDAEDGGNDGARYVWKIRKMRDESDEETEQESDKDRRGVDEGMENEEGEDDWLGPYNDEFNNGYWDVQEWLQDFPDNLLGFGF